MTFRVNLTDAARDDVRAILRWIENRSEAGALTWYRRWLQVLNTLESRADSLGLAPESEEHSEPIHQVIFKTKHGRPYRALYILRERNVFVLHVRGPGQDFFRSENVRTKLE